MKECTIQLVVPMVRRIYVTIEAESMEEALEQAKEKYSNDEEIFYREDENDSYDMEQLEIYDISEHEIEE